MRPVDCPSTHKIRLGACRSPEGHQTPSFERTAFHELCRAILHELFVSGYSTRSHMVFTRITAPDHQTLLLPDADTQVCAVMPTSHCRLQVYKARHGAAS